ncbi:hypothetical protein HK098_005169 [Nowakowskiella sp. JEL0407]|nr:hypothetical protein HK098_005169 [Nowakowskiella sp. JEL0407]
MSSNNTATILPFSDNGSASTAYIILNAALVFLMIPGIGLFYAGISRSKNALSIIMITFLITAVVTIQWILFGFSLTYSETGNPVIGNCDMCGMKNVDQRALLLTAKSVPAADWTWSANGWLHNLSCLGASTPCMRGALDFAGGGPVHMCSGFSGLAYALALGPRTLRNTFRPHNLTLVFLGTALLWFGWFGFNAGSSLDATPRAAMAGLVTTTAAAAAGLSWTFCDLYFSSRMRGISFCSGAVAGLVAITPAAGFVQPWVAIVIGIIAGIACNFGSRIKTFFKIDDAFDAFGIHGVGGVVGSLLTGVFAQKTVAKLDDVAIEGGLIEGNAIQLAYQLAEIGSISAYSFIVSYLLLAVINMFYGLHIRISEDDEVAGVDLTEMGEIAYELVEPADDVILLRPLRVRE